MNEHKNFSVLAFLVFIVVIENFDMHTPQPVASSKVHLLPLFERTPGSIHI